MSRKSRERREKNKTVRSDDYFSNGVFEMARFGKVTIVRNNRTPEQHAAQMEYLCTEYTSKYEDIAQKVKSLKEKIAQCDPYSLLMHLRSLAAMGQMNIFSEIEYSSDANAIIRAQEYVQSILVSTENNYVPSKPNEAAALYAQIVADFDELYKSFMFFYCFWAAHIQESREIDNSRLNEIVESQYMYWVRGNRYQIFELEPLKTLLPPHNDVLLELFGVSSVEVIDGLKKLQYSLSQGYADAIMELNKEFERFVEATDSGSSPEDAYKCTERRTSKIAGKLHGSDLINVATITGWDPRFINMLSYGINECSTFWGESEFAGWPIVEFPVTKKPFIKIDGTSYAFLYYALFDNIYRNIQKGIMQRKPQYLEEWKEKQTQASEEMVKELFLKLLPGAEAHVSNYYPVKNSLKQTNENDIIITYQNNLFVIEVKAGSFPSTPPITDFDAHIKAYQKLAEVADSQCSRTIEYIANHSPAQFYDHEKNPIFSLPSLNAFDDVFTFSVTVDNFNEFAAKAEKLSVISLKEETIVISYDDLLAYAGYFDAPICFLHYLKQRKAAMRAPQYQMHDELDHLGLYIDKNLYALNSSLYDDVKNVVWQGFRKTLDEYFNMLFANPSAAKKPTQDMPNQISEIIEYLGHDISPEKIHLAHYLMDLSLDAKEDLAWQIEYALRRQGELKHTVVLAAFGEIKYCAFISMPGIIQYPIQEQLDYAYAAASRNEKIPVMWISLEYDNKSRLVSAEGRKCCFSDLKGDDIERIRHMGCEKARDWVLQYKMIHGKIGRNDYCPCGSGKKYKFCCIETQ